MSEPPNEGKGEEGEGEQPTPSDGQGNQQGQGSGNQPSDSGNGSAPKPQGWGEVIEPKKADGTALSDTEYKLAEADVDQKLLNASQHRDRGDIPTELHGIIDELLEPTILWSDQFDRFMKGGDNPDGWSDEKINIVRYRTTGVIDPTIKRRGIGHVVVAQDQSGSVHDSELKKGFTELNYLCETLNPESVTVIPFDASVNADKVQFFDQGEEVEKINIKGRGGTCVQPVFDYIDETGIDVDRLVVFTDMGIFDYPKDAPDYPVLWVNVSPSKSEAPFGETIRVDQ
jgi:predicted metal-dependent peptidase